jgi:hypothetical protein
MIKRMEWEMVSRRRMFSFLGLAVAAGLALGSTAAKAQTTGSEAQTPGSNAATPGAARRQERRGGRVERRYERRGGTPASKQPATNAPATNPPAAQKQ